MDVVKETTRVLDEVLSLGGRAAAFTRDTPLLGAIPELDSMAVVSLINTLEERFGIMVDDDDIDGATFATVGSLADFVSAYNFGRRLKTLKGLTPYEYICKCWTSQPTRFKLNPIHQMPGLNS